MLSTGRLSPDLGFASWSWSHHNSIVTTVRYLDHEVLRQTLVGELAVRVRKQKIMAGASTRFALSFGTIRAVTYAGSRWLPDGRRSAIPLDTAFL